MAPAPLVAIAAAGKVAVGARYLCKYGPAIVRTLKHAGNVFEEGSTLVQKVRAGKERMTNPQRVGAAVSATVANPQEIGSVKQATSAALAGHPPGVGALANGESAQVRARYLHAYSHGFCIRQEAKAHPGQQLASDYHSAVSAGLQSKRREKSASARGVSARAALARSFPRTPTQPSSDLSR